MPIFDSNLIQHCLTAFLLGLASSGHCIAMCGSFICRFSATTELQQSKQLNDGKAQSIDIIDLSDSSPAPSTSSKNTLLFHLGRISCYTLLGLSLGLVALVFQQASQQLALSQSSYLLTASLLRLCAAILLIFSALYIAGFSQSIKRLEQMMTPLWRKLSPLSQNLMAMQSAKQSCLLGLLWGFIPCGMIYSTLAWAISLQQGPSTALLMLSFGLGTSPSLLVLHSMSNRLQFHLNKRWVKKAMALIIIIMALFSLQPVFHHFKALYQGQAEHSHHHH